MFSLAGLPPMVGFYAKLAILQALVTTNVTSDLVLAVVAVMLSLVGAFYYLRVVKVMYFDEPVQTAAIERGTGVSAMLAINGAAVLLFGLLPGGLMAICRDAIVKALTT
jgi:NADH-quinone oxidoreductase subunit N